MPKAARQQPGVGEPPFRLHEGRDRFVGRFRHPVDLRVDQLLVGAVAGQVEPERGPQVHPEQVAARPAELAALFLGRILRLVVPVRVAPVAPEVAPVAAAVEGLEIHPVQLRLQEAAGQVMIGVIQHHRCRAVAGAFAFAAAGRGRGQLAGGDVARHGAVVVVALQFVVVGADLQPALVVEVPADLGEEVVAARVHQVALDVVDGDRPAIAVVIESFAGQGGAADEVDVAAARAEDVGRLVARAVVFARDRHACADANIVERLAVLAGRALGDDVDDAAGGAQALQRIGAVDHFDPLDHRRIDGVAVASAFAQWRRLRYAVDQIQRLAAAQVLTGVGQLLAGRREGRNQVGQDLGQVLCQRQLLIQLLAIDDGNGVRQGRGGIRNAAGAGRDRHAVELDGIVGLRNRSRAQNG